MPRRIDMFTWMRLLLVPLLAAAGLVLTSAPAYADCPTPPRKSAHAFTGAVTSVEWDGRLAHVTTDRGAKVVVHGAESETAVSSVDRTYRVGARYKFHPLNDRSPYQDSACTATHRIAGGTGMRFAGMRVAGEQSGAAPGGIDWTSGPMLAGFAGLALALGAGGAWLARRTRRDTPVT